MRFVVTVIREKVLSVFSFLCPSFISPTANADTAPADYEAPPAFQAYVAGGGISFTPFSTITIKYTDVSLSSSDYSSSTGLFTAPVTGTAAGQ